MELSSYANVQVCRHKSVEIRVYYTTVHYTPTLVPVNKYTGERLTCVYDNLLCRRFDALCSTRGYMSISISVRQLIKTRAHAQRPIKCSFILRCVGTPCFRPQRENSIQFILSLEPVRKNQPFSLYSEKLLQNESIKQIY